VERPVLEGERYNVLGIQDYYAKNGAIEGLERVRRQGKTRYLGFIVRGNDRGPVEELIDTGLFHIINVPYTLLNPSGGYGNIYGLKAEPDYGNVISYAEAHGVGTAIYSPLAAGLLTDQVVSGAGYHPLSRTYGQTRESQLQRARALAGVLSHEGQSLAQAAYRFILMHTGVTVALSGVSDMAQLEEVATTTGAPPLTKEEMARVEMIWRFS
jgi:L-glyceraldehyde 3-phosphate reductase